jgi:FKBP-type peptidyl-prolyl cis-trans isomerase 2
LNHEAVIAALFGNSQSPRLRAVLPKGWTEALQLMPVGSKWQLFLPADLAYGDRQAGPDITPGSTLIFEVELLSIQDKNAAPARAGADKK